MKISVLIATFVAIVATPALPETNHQPYKGFEARDISSLSESDIADLQSGAGWGLALPAELNGFPGPAHVLELQDKLNLTPNQLTEMQGIYDAMKVEAIAVGNTLIAAERALDQGFKSGELTATTLRALIDTAEAARADLRYIHLSRHLLSVGILSREQSATYSELRGYTSDPCQSVPDGHDPTMWRRHNGCDG